MLSGSWLRKEPIFKRQSQGVKKNDRVSAIEVGAGKGNHSSGNAIESEGEREEEREVEAI